MSVTLSATQHVLDHAAKTAATLPAATALLASNEERQDLASPLPPHPAAPMLVA
jgi:hypothetical protein